MKYALMITALFTLGGCTSTSLPNGWSPTYEQPGGLRQDTPYYHNGTAVRDLGDYGRRPGRCISNGAQQWDINWEIN